VKVTIGPKGTKEDKIRKFDSFGPFCTKIDRPCIFQVQYYFHGKKFRKVVIGVVVEANLA